MPDPPTRDAADRFWLQRAVDLSRKCPRSWSAYAVGAVVVTAQNDVLSVGWSRDSDPRNHAEESALADITRDDPRLKGATIYSSLEPCSQRRSRPDCCATLILRSGLRRVVLAWNEPSLFVSHCTGVEMLVAEGADVVHLVEFAEAARSVNAHLFDG